MTASPAHTAAEVIDVTAAIIVHRGRVLVARRHDHVHLGGLWEFPGGKVEDGELLAACLRREIREELGMQLSRIRTWRDLRHVYPERTVHLYFFRCWVTDAQAQAARPHGSQEIRWADAADLRTLPFPDADREILKAVAALLPRSGA